MDVFLLVYDVWQVVEARERIATKPTTTIA